jgi:hypothetical protein
VIFQDPINERLKNFIFEEGTVETPITWKILLNEFDESEDQQRITEIWENDTIEITSDKILKDYIKQVTHNFMKIQRDELKSDIEEAGKNGHHDVIPNLMEIYTEMQKNLKQLEAEIYSGT